MKWMQLIILLIPIFIFELCMIFSVTNSIKKSKPTKRRTSYRRGSFDEDKIERDKFRLVK